MKFNFFTTFSRFKSFGVEGNQKTKMGPKKPRAAYSILYESPVQRHYFKSINSNHYLKSIDSKLLY